MVGETSYDSYQHWKGWAAAGFGVCGQADAAYFAVELSRSGIPDIRGVRILELGFGNGAFAGWAVQGEGIYTGVEAIPALVSLGRERGFDVSEAGHGLGELTGLEAVDVVVAFDVLEHLEVPAIRSKLEEIHAVLKPNGLFIARLPSGDSPFARAVQHGDLTHRSILGSSAMRQLGEWTGLSVEQVRAPALPLTGLGMGAFLRRIVVLAGRAVTYPLISRLFMGGGSPVLSPNMIVVFRKRDAGR